ncbi:hypothetical protein BC826DRAFT_982844 [Russula brevipes]|nr:hypothetical protein BC826DRAFT_982844 [Russula brevipes]
MTSISFFESDILPLLLLCSSFIRLLFCFARPTYRDGVHAFRVYPGNDLPGPHRGSSCFSQSGTFRPSVEG